MGIVTQRCVRIRFESGEVDCADRVMPEGLDAPAGRLGQDLGSGPTDRGRQVRT